MADGRMLRKKISVDGRWGDLKNDTFRLLFTVAIAHLDIEGRISGDPREFKASVVPMLDHLTREVVTDFFQDAESLGLLRRYQVDGRWVVEYPAFKKNQNLRPEKEAKSQYPPPPNDYGPEKDRSRELPEVSGSSPEVVREDSRRTPAEVKEKEVKEIYASSPPPDGGSDDAKICFACKHFSIEDKYFRELITDYPGITDKILLMELKKIRDWFDDNPHSKHQRTTKGFLKNPKSFIRNWLSKLTITPALLKAAQQSAEAEPEGSADPNCGVCHGTGWDDYTEEGLQYRRPCGCIRRASG